MQLNALSGWLSRIIRALMISEETPLNQIEALLVALRRVIRATDLHSKHLAKTTGLTAPQILIMQAVRNHVDVTVGALASEVSLSQATVTSILDRLEKKQLVFRQRSETDKRKVFVRLTENGGDVLKTAPIPLQHQLASHFQTLEEWEQLMIVSSLQRVAIMIGAEDIDASPVLDVGLIDRSSTAPQ